MTFNSAPPPPQLDECPIEPPQAEVPAFESTINFIAKWESFVDHVYPDAGGRPTIGHGFLLVKGTPLWSTYMLPTGSPKPGMKITRQASLALLAQKVYGVQTDVKAALKHPPSNHQLTAMVSLAYNIGLPHFRGSTLLERYNALRLRECPAEFLRWDLIDGKKSDGLLNRRQAEAALFCEGE